MYGALMFVSKIVMEFLPNVHLLGTLTMVATVVWRKKALIPIYGYVALNGAFAGFSVWWMPYLYIWTLLWGATMLLPKRMPKKVAAVVYPILCSLHGFLFGILYAPAQALFFGLNFEQTLAWIATGAVFDVIHGVSNFAVGLLVLPLSELVEKLAKSPT
jgi:energy-coupling factor transport system substrate-specific component